MKKEKKKKKKWWRGRRRSSRGRRRRKNRKRRIRIGTWKKKTEKEGTGKEEAEAGGTYWWPRCPEKTPWPAPWWRRRLERLHKLPAFCCCYWQRRFSGMTIRITSRIWCKPYTSAPKRTPLGAGPRRVRKGEQKKVNISIALMARRLFGQTSFVSLNVIISLPGQRHWVDSRHHPWHRTQRMAWVKRKPGRRSCAL